ncbi:DUF4421 domain-containing protein [Gramella sp. MT6]|uniref:DUF4421 domain-containing protein n=1 Tax=Gramella sp. MT6 TaxID=2705471 RepID=UPI001C5DA855|nr:DUF4421 domain-containing protein [Gramella sp. MT6]QYA24949.1 DUF4421 domain-containing protein [Gramella sp. MT6]
MGLKAFFIVFLLFAASFSNAQDIELDSIKELNYIQKFPNKITGRLFYINTSNSFEFKGRLTDQRVSLTPNKQNRIGASIAFKAIKLSYSFAPDFMAENQDNEDSKLFNIGLRTYLGKWMQTLNLYNEKGFYLEAYGQELYLPRTSSLKIGGSTGYIFNENFSFRSITNQDEKQLKSAGSFLPQLIYYYTKYGIKGDGDSGQQVDEKYHSVDVALSPGYYYNWVPTKNLMISAGAAAGLGVNFSNGTDSESLTSLLYDLNFRGAINYDFSDFYAGAQYSYLILNHNTDRTTYTEDNIPYFEAFIGYRFKAPKKILDISDDVNKKIDSIKN